MPKGLLLCFCFFVILPVLYGQSPGSFLAELDNTVQGTAVDIRGLLPSGPALKIAVGQWFYRDGLPAFSSYWASQLTEALAGLPNRSFILLSGGAGGADLTISGEIIEVAGIIRVYTRILRSGNREIAASLHSDFARTQNLVEMLLDGGTSSSVPWDVYEPDSRENLLPVEIAADVINRTIHGRGDADYFLLLPDQDGFLRMETTGDTDTVMEFFEAGSERVLEENDDGGSNGNARIQYQVTAGTSYVVKVRGYGDETGAYGFRAFFTESVFPVPDEYEGDDDFSSAKTITLGSSQQHNFHRSNDVDWVKFEISRAGNYTVRTRGVNTTQLDTYIELYDIHQDLVDEDDDGGESLDSCLTLNLRAGTYYVKVRCLDDEPEEPYTIIIEAENAD